MMHVLDYFDQLLRHEGLAHDAVWMNTFDTCGDIVDIPAGDEDRTRGQTAQLDLGNQFEAVALSLEIEFENGTGAASTFSECPRRRRGGT